MRSDASHHGWPIALADVRDRFRAQTKTPASGAHRCQRLLIVPRLVVVRTRPAEWLRQKQTRHISPAHRALRQGPRYMLRFCRTNKSIAKTPALPTRQIFCVATKVRNPLSCPASGLSIIMIVRAEMALRAVFATHHGICRKTVAKPAFGKKLPVCRD